MRGCKRDSQHRPRSSSATTWPASTTTPCCWPRGMNGLREIVEDLFMDAPGLKLFDTFPVYRVVKAGLEIPTQ